MNDLFLSPLEISNALSRIGVKKATATIAELFIFGILAGIYIAFGANGATFVLSGGTLDAGLAMFLAGSVFSVGLMLVLMPGSELFTGNILMTIGFIYRKYAFTKVLRNWFLVYFGNFLGAIFIAWLVLNSGLLGYIGDLNSIGKAAVSIMEAKLQLGFVEALCRGILCNMLVVCGYEHSVANMYFLPIGLMMEGKFFSHFFIMFNNLIPVTIGNIIGGLLIVLLHPKVEERIARIFVRKTDHQP